jgi:hypothetical protein
MSRNKPDYTKFMRKPPPLEPRPEAQPETPVPPAAQEIPWAEIVPIEEGEIAFTDPGEIAYFERIDTPPQSRGGPAASPPAASEKAPKAEPQPPPAPERPVATSGLPPVAPRSSGTPVQAGSLIFYDATPPAPILACGLFLVILAFLAC